jgi:hypothetical protein
MNPLSRLVGVAALSLAAVGAAAADPAIGDFSTFELVSSRRVSRLITEFEYRVPLTADLQDLAGASVTVTSLSAFTTIVDGSLSFGLIPAGTTAFSVDTFSFRHDRRVPFDPSVLELTLDAQPANRPPAADAGPDQTVRVTDRVTLDGSGSTDPDGDLLSFAWSFVSVPAGSMALLSDSTAVMPTFDVDVPGSYVLELVVNDGAVASAPDSVVIDTANSPPVANAGADQTVRVNESVVLEGSGSTDVDGDLLSFAWTLSVRPPGSAAALVNPTEVTSGFEVDVPGTYVVELVVNDGLVDSAPDVVVIDTRNSPPVADAGPDQTVFVTDRVTLDGSGSSDVDGDLLSFQWSFSAIPAGSTASLSNPAATGPTFVVDLPGTYVLQLVVDDGSVASSPDSVSIVTENSPPVADPGPDQSVLLFETVILDGSGSDDVDSDPLTFRWSFTSVPAGSGAALDDSSAVTPSFVADVPGSYVVQLIVNDGTVDSDPQTVTVTTENSPPVAHAGFDQTTALGGTVVLDGSLSSDADSDPLTFSWTLASVPAGSAAVLSDATAVSPEFVADVEGVYIAELVVNDGELASPPDTVRITVNPLPRIDLFLPPLGGGLGYRTSADLAVANHGGVTVHIESSDPALALVAPDLLTPGSAFLDVFVPDGSTAAAFVVQGIFGARGAARVTASAPGFAPEALDLSVVEPAISFSGLSSTASVGVNDEFGVLVGVPNASGTGLSAFQPFSAANSPPLEMTFASSNGAVGVMSHAGSSGPSVTFQPAAGEFQFRPVFVPTGAGTTVVSASVPGFAPTTSSSQSVTVSAPLVAPFSRTIGSGLQFGGSASLAIGNHGGVTVRVESGNPAVALIAPDAATPGLAFIDVFVPDGSSSAPYVVQGVLGSMGTVEVTASAPGFSSGVGSVEVVQAGLILSGLASSPAAGGNDPFTIITGPANAAGTGILSLQGMSAANAPQPEVTVSSTDGAVGQLTRGGLTGDSIVFLPSAGEFQISVTFNALAPGTTTVSASIANFLTTTAATRVITVVP